MKLSEIPIRDPFILPYDGIYYLFGTNGDFSQKGYGFLCRTSCDLVEWSDEKICFTPPEDFWADAQFWAPEVHEYNGKFYMFASFYRKDRDGMRRTQILCADSPDGPYVPLSHPVTPEQWMCLDGTLYVENGVPYMVFCHEWLQTINGEMCLQQLSQDLKETVGEPVLLFCATEQSSCVQTRSGGFITDGPWVYKTNDGKLLMLWSTFTEKGYCQAVAVSQSGKVCGPWKQCQTLLSEANGGHGMIFQTFEGDLYFTMHRPNSPGGAERAALIPICEIQEEPYLQLEKKREGRS